VIHDDIVDVMMMMMMMMMMMIFVINVSTLFSVSCIHLRILMIRIVSMMVSDTTNVPAYSSHHEADFNVSISNQKATMMSM